MVEKFESTSKKKWNPSPGLLSTSGHKLKECIWLFLLNVQNVSKDNQKKSPEKLSLLENIDENKSVSNEMVINTNQPNEAIRIIKKYEIILNE